MRFLFVKNVQKFLNKLKIPKIAEACE